MCSYNAINGIPACANDFILNKVLRGQWNMPNAHITTDCGAVKYLLEYPIYAGNFENAVTYTINNGTDIGI